MPSCVRLSRRNYEFDVEEWVSQARPGSPPTQLLASSRGEGWWWSGKRGEQVPLRQGAAACALASGFGLGEYYQTRGFGN